MKKYLLILIALLSLSFQQKPCTCLRYSGTVLKVIDGDTFIVDVDLGFDVYKWVDIRMAKINAPELSSKDSVAAKASRDYLKTRILNKTIYFNSKAYDKYHRSIADIFLEPFGTSKSINQELVDKGYARTQKY